MAAIAEFPVTAASPITRPYRILVCDDQPDVLRAIEPLFPNSIRQRAIDLIEEFVDKGECQFTTAFGRPLS